MPDDDVEAAPAAIRRRAVTGAALVVARGFVVRLLGFATYIVAARFVSPEEFGVFTLGAAVVLAGQFVSDAGMGAALVRRPEEPEHADLRAVQGLQLAISGSLAAVALLVGAAVGGDGLVVGAMVLSLPIITLRVPALTLLERHLSYKPLVVVEVAETLAYSAFVVVAVMAGAGVWGLALAVVVRAIAGTIAMTRVGPVGFVAPSLDPERLRPLVRFGAKFQAVGAVPVLNEQVFNAGVAAVAGIGTLGMWGLANRITQLPQLVFVSLRRVSYPAMSRLVGAGEDLRLTVERTARLTAVTSGLVLVPLVGSSSALVPLVFGARWSDAADILPGVCLGLIVGGPVSVAVAAYLLAADHAGLVLRAVILRVTTSLVLSLCLLPVIGVVALGIGYGTASIVEAALFAGAVRKAIGVRLGVALFRPCASAIVASVAGMAVTAVAGGGVASCAVGGLLSLGLFAAAVWILSRDVLVDAIRLVRQLVRRRSGDHPGEPVGASPG
jgi:O-antigen/teichoic acid export membrane protein